MTKGDCRAEAAQCNARAEVGMTQPADMARAVGWLVTSLDREAANGAAVSWRRRQLIGRPDTRRLTGLVGTAFTDRRRRRAASQRQSFRSTPGRWKCHQSFIAGLSFE